MDGRAGKGAKLKETLKVAVQKGLNPPDSTLQWGDMIQQQQQQSAVLGAEQAVAVTSEDSIKAEEDEVVDCISAGDWS